MAREARQSSTREALSRARTREDKGVLHIPKEIIPKGMVYSWVGEYLLGEPTDNNVEKRLRGGWVPVESAKHPELAAPALPGRERTDHGVIRRGGLILCQMSKREFDAIQNDKSAENRSMMNSTAWTRGELQDDDKRMPMVELADDPGMNQTNIERVVALPEK